MATIISKNKQLKAVYEQVKGDFKVTIFTIHNLLWQVVANRLYSSETVTFYPEIVDGKHCLLFVFNGLKGFKNTCVEFENHVDDKKAQQVCNYLNQQVFGQTKEDSFKIVAQSF